MIEGLVLLLAFVVAALLCWRFSSPDSLFHVLDHPGERSLHQQATPRSGGVALVIAILLAWLVAIAWGLVPGRGGMAWVMAGVILLAVVGGIDDRRDLSPLKRLLAQLLAAFFLVAAGLVPETLELPGKTLFLPGWLAYGFSLLFMLWMTNLYNFMDGMDGFAGGMAVAGFGAMAWLGWRAGDPGFALAALSVVAASLGFLLFNFPPARIFMGDAGSPVLGYLAAAFLLQADHSRLFPLWVGVLIFSPFIVDATYTLSRRLLAGKKIWQAHREHIYQRLVQSGWSHRRTVLWSYVLMLAVASTAGMALELNPQVQWGILSAWMLAYLAIIMLTAKRETGNP
ncbi:MraY family glycosyltransferase [Thiolapillus brandeum]|uniref:Glycosyl transferase family 4 n=1 Tax=Thiolapillus brandeum TaxID=1076588 RepID=A0A7U6JGD6_9GAMM|nr:glycosyltransferase family 4 protein [Thiolapillus brandeum]BAO43416.1 glycosyl transferase family 4 [Thiolapillus brandeum]